MTRLYLPASDIREGDVLVKTYGVLPVFETYETRRGTVAICVTLPSGQEFAFHHRRGTKLLVDRPDP